MRSLPALALALTLLIAAPALGQIKGEEMGSEQQTEGYGRIFGYVCGVIALGLIVAGGYQMFKGFMAESARGKKTGALREDVLDKTPRKDPERYIGEKVPDWKIANRTAATKAGLKFLAAYDEMFVRKDLFAVAEEAFRAIKAAIEDRSLKAAEPLVTQECLDDLRDEFKGLKKKGLVRRFGEILVTDIQIVHVEAPPKQDQQTFTAMISSRSRDFQADERTGKVRRGDKKTYNVQEFWRFRRAKSKWLVERIRPSGDMDVVLKPKNLLSVSDYAQFAKEAEEEHLKEYIAK
jgi:predicted lipid-binding transport protein (Tim44 family)